MSKSRTGRTLIKRVLKYFKEDPKNHWIQGQSWNGRGGYCVSAALSIFGTNKANDEARKALRASGAVKLVVINDIQGFNAVIDILEKGLKELERT
jgi:hypothetical protein